MQQQSYPRNNISPPQDPGFLRTFWDYLTKPSFAKAGLTLLSVVGLGYASQYFEGTQAMLFQGAASFFALMLCIQVTRCCCCCWGSDNTKQNAVASSNSTDFGEVYNLGLQAGINLATQQSQFYSTYAGQPGMPAVVNIHNNSTIPPKSDPIRGPSISYSPPLPPPPTAPPPLLSTQEDTRNQTPKGRDETESVQGCIHSGFA